MAKLGNATIEVGDVLRRDVDDREGTVTDVSGSKITLLLFGSDEVVLSASDCYFNVTDSKYEASGKAVPSRTPTDMGSANSEIVSAYESQAAAEAKAAAEAVEAARAEAVQMAAKVREDEEARVAAIVAAREAEEAASASRIQRMLDNARVEGAAMAMASIEVVDVNGESITDADSIEEENDPSVFGDLEPPEITIEDDSEDAE